ncbi:MAG: hypothetical protein HOP17_00085 [Acidobacteria bacterium]|nr:hypothetical protein [Acidobacteriota bacterium]
MSYVSNIANSILSKSVDTAVLGPEMYTAIAEWEKKEIPAAIVMISIDEVRLLESSEFGEELPVEMFQSMVARNFTTWLPYAGDAIHRSV